MGRIWDHVAQVGGGGGALSAVYLGNGFLLTGRAREVLHGDHADMPVFFEQRAVLMTSLRYGDHGVMCLAGVD